MKYVDQHIRKSLRSKDGLVFYPAHNMTVAGIQPKSTLTILYSRCSATELDRFATFAELNFRPRVSDIPRSDKLVEYSDVYPAIPWSTRAAENSRTNRTIRVICAFARSRLC